LTKNIETSLVSAGDSIGLSLSLSLYYSSLIQLALYLLTHTIFRVD